MQTLSNLKVSEDAGVVENAMNVLLSFMMTRNKGIVVLTRTMGLF